LKGDELFAFDSLPVFKHIVQPILPSRATSTKAKKASRHSDQCSLFKVSYTKNIKRKANTILRNESYDGRIWTIMQCSMVMYIMAMEVSKSNG
jgi:hypothetical protein